MTEGQADSGIGRHITFRVTKSGTFSLSGFPIFANISAKSWTNLPNFHFRYPESEYTFAKNSAKSWPLCGQSLGDEFRIPIYEITDLKMPCYSPCMPPLEAPALSWSVTTAEDKGYGGGGEACYPCLIGGRIVGHQAHQNEDDIKLCMKQ